MTVLSIPLTQARQIKSNKRSRVNLKLVMLTTIDKFR